LIASNHCLYRISGPRDRSVLGRDYAVRIVIIV
jgi:hypothetical protein